MKKKYNLLFMGDSLTAGVYSDGFLDYSRNSYPDFIEQHFKKNGILKSSYNIAVSGFTSKNLLDMLSEDLTYNENIAFNITPESTYRKFNYRKHNTAKLLKNDIKINTLIADSNIIIMTLGSNDIIKYFNSYLDELNFKDIISSSDKSDILLKMIFMNFKDIIKHIRNINKKTKIVFIGSYTPIKYDLINKLLDKYLSNIESAIFENISNLDDNIQIIKIRRQISAHKKLYVDNPLDVHLNEVGYKLMSDIIITELAIY